MVPTILVGSASSCVIMSLTDVAVEKMSWLTRSICEALVHFDLVIVFASFTDENNMVSKKKCAALTPLYDSLHYARKQMKVLMNNNCEL
jgi:hypothetical protein